MRVPDALPARTTAAVASSQTMHRTNRQEAARPSRCPARFSRPGAFSTSVPAPPQRAASLAPSTRSAIRRQPSNKLTVREDPGSQVPPLEFRDQLVQALRTPGDELAPRPPVRREASVEGGLLDCARVTHAHQAHRRILANGPDPHDILRSEDEEGALREILLEIMQKKDRHARPIAAGTAAELCLRRGEPSPLS